MTETHTGNFASMKLKRRVPTTPSLAPLLVPRQGYVVTSRNGVTVIGGHVLPLVSAAATAASAAALEAYYDENGNMVVAVAAGGASGSLSSSDVCTTGRRVLLNCSGFHYHPDALVAHAHVRGTAGDCLVRVRVPDGVDVVCYRCPTNRIEDCMFAASCVVVELVVTDDATLAALRTGSRLLVRADNRAHRWHWVHVTYDCGRLVAVNDCGSAEDEERDDNDNIDDS